MKFRNVLLGFGAVALSIGLSSCNTSDDSNYECQEDFTGALLENENVILGKWELSAILADKEVDLTRDNEDNPKKDIYVQYSECEKDTDFIYTSDRAYSNSQGQNAENCTNKATFKGTWKFKDNILSLAGNCSSQNLLLDFNEDKTSYSYKGNYTITDVHGQQFQTDVTFTYTKVNTENELQPVE